MTRLALVIAIKGNWNAHQLDADLAAAGIPGSVEVLVACDADHATTHPRFSVHAAPGASLFGLWGLGIRHSSAPWVAILHGAGLPGDNWFNAIIGRIEREGWPDGYWGPVEPRRQDNAKVMLGYLNEYCQFHRPISRNLQEIPGSNLVLPRARLDSTGPLSKTRLQREGLAPKFVDAVVLYDRSNALIPYCRRRFHHAQAFAAARSPRVPLYRAIPLTVLLPFVRTLRMLRHAWRHPRLRGTAIRLLPSLLLAETFWSFGEFVGYLTRRPAPAAELD